MKNIKGGNVNSLFINTWRGKDVFVVLLHASSQINMCPTIMLSARYVKTFSIQESILLVSIIYVADYPPL